MLGQIRPTTSQTLYPQDLVGEVVDASSWLLAVDALNEGRIVSGDLSLPGDDEPARVECIPVRRGREVPAVMVRAHRLVAGRRPGELEKTYLDVFSRLAAMVAEGSFPFEQEFVTEEAPRVGDGILLVDSDGLVVFASPNATSALHRIGIYANLRGQSLREMGLDESAVDRAIHTRLPVIEEIERRPDITVLLHCLPLVAGGSLSGLLVVLRDVSDVRRLDRLLLSKDASIREVHHRVKNNLQTISALLRLQARRVGEPTAVMALQEAGRRVRAIAVVHEILARGATDKVPFQEIITRLVAMAEETAATEHGGSDDERSAGGSGGARGGTVSPVQIEVEGDAGELNASVATPLAVVVAELLQNAVRHAFPGGLSPSGTPGHIRVGLERGGGVLQVEVADDGVGLPDGFEIGSTTSLGLSIVRDLVVSQLGGEMTLESPGGTTARLVIPLEG